MTTNNPSVERYEITPGLALFLDPDVMEQEGATYTCPPKNRVRGKHYFLVAQVVEWRESAMLLPLYSNGGKFRSRLRNAAMSGSNYWVSGTWHWDVRQVWLAPLKSIPLAALIAGDKSRPVKRNRLAASALPEAWK